MGWKDSPPETLEIISLYILYRAMQLEENANFLHFPNAKGNFVTTFPSISFPERKKFQTGYYCKNIRTRPNTLLSMFFHPFSYNGRIVFRAQKLERKFCGRYYRAKILMHFVTFGNESVYLSCNMPPFPFYTSSALLPTSFGKGRKKIRWLGEKKGENCYMLFILADFHVFLFLI